MAFLSRMTAQSYEKYFTRAIGLRKINVLFFEGRYPPLPAVCYIVTIVTIVTAAIHVARVYIYIIIFLLSRICIVRIYIL